MPLFLPERSPLAASVIGKLGRSSALTAPEAQHSLASLPERHDMREAAHAIPPK